MDKEQEQLKHFEFFCIFRESIKLIFSCPKIFIQITLSLVLPLCFVFLADSQISQSIFSDKRISRYSQPGIGRWGFDIAYIIIVLILYLLVTATVVYIIVCIYTSQVMTFKKVMSVVPKVWTRLLCTFFVGFLFLFIYHVVAIGVLVLWILLLRTISVVGIVVGVVLMVLYLIGVVYITIVWNLANVMSVVEEKINGIKALKKSRILIQGKIVVSVFILFVVSTCLGGIQALFQIFVVDRYPSVGIRIGFAILCLLLMTTVVLLSLVIQTVTYFVCKSYHRENIEGSSLLHLHGHHVPPNAPNRYVQLERLNKEELIEEELRNY